MQNKSGFKIEKGSPQPLGVSRTRGGINFALYSEHATKVTLCLFSPHEAHPFFEHSLDPATNKTQNTWHIWIKGLPAQVEYGYRIDGPTARDKGLFFDNSRILSDPYALSLATSHRWGEGYPEGTRTPLGRIILSTDFDWEGVEPPRIPIERLIIYEMHVRAFTVDRSSDVKYPGSFLGMIEKIPYLKELGVNAVELLPIHEFNECENPRKHPITHKRLYNFWGYSTVNFFSPMNRYATTGEWSAAIDEFKTLVRELHRNDIEVILDVVYNHTAEAGEKGPTFSFRGIDNPAYYMLMNDGKYQDFTGCGNTVNCNHPVTQELILASLRYWAQEMHVDGFRFDLASILTRDPSGKPIEKPPIIEAITKDPVLSETKLIAEAWDAAGLYQVGSFPGGERWSEWNGVYRDIIRRFIKGTDGQAGSFATAISGSENVYGKEGYPTQSVNFVTAHDGFTLRDLVSYNSKHNEGNGEENRDGLDNNDSWNCGIEGATHDRFVLHLREKQMRNFHLALMVSIGIPMILMGDEYGHSRFGNNNGWAQDNEINWFLWNELKKEKAFFRFYKLLIEFRKAHPIFTRTSFLGTEDVEWHGHEPGKPNWGSRFVAYTLKDPSSGHFLYVAFNAHYEKAHLTLPSPPHKKKWCRVIDTSLHSPDDFTEHPLKHPLRYTYDLDSYSALVLKAF
jgi:isoamylase/glycogen operon protein